MSLAIKIVTPARVTFEGTADQIKAPGWLGEFGVLPQHAQMLTLTKPGVITLVGGGADQRWLVSHGFAEVGPDHVTLLVDSSEAVDAIDKGAASDELRQAEEALGQAEVGTETHRAATRRVEVARARVAA